MLPVHTNSTFRAHPFELAVIIYRPDLLLLDATLNAAPRADRPADRVLLQGGDKLFNCMGELCLAGLG